MWPLCHCAGLTVRRILQLFYAKIMVFGDGQFYRGFGGYWDFGFWDVVCLSLSIWNGFGIN